MQRAAVMADRAASKSLTQDERRELLRIFSEENWRSSGDVDREGAGPYLELPPDD
jgi:hypothetical protein